MTDWRETLPRTLRAYLPAAAWAAILLWLGGRTGLPSPRLALPLDKLAHLIIYGILGWLVGRGWLRAGRRPHAAVVLLLAVACGAADELHQRGVPGRSAELADWAVDVVAVVAGFAAARRAQGFRKDA